MSLTKVGRGDKALISIRAMINKQLTLQTMTGCNCRSFLLMEDISKPNCFHFQLRFDQMEFKVGTFDQILFT